MSSTRMVMGDPPDKKGGSNLKWLFIILGLVVIVLVVYFVMTSGDSVEIAQDTTTPQTQRPQTASESKPDEPKVPPPVEKPDEEVQEKPEPTKQPDNQVTVQEKATPDFYIVQQGDCLWNIAKEQLYDPFKWGKIYQINQEKIHDPDLIYPNQNLALPKL